MKREASENKAGFGTREPGHDPGYGPGHQSSVAHADAEACCAGNGQDCTEAHDPTLQQPPDRVYCHPLPVSRRRGARSLFAFTLIELLIVMSIIALLLTIAAPRYFHSADRAKEAVLKENLRQMRDAIDKYYGDRGRYPDSLDELVEKKYLRRIPPDTVTDSAQTWVTVPPDETAKGAVSDVKSGASGTAQDGTSYSGW